MAFSKKGEEKAAGVLSLVAGRGTQPNTTLTWGGRDVHHTIAQSRTNLIF